VKTTTVGVLGSLAINVVLGLLVAAVFSVTPAVQAREVAQCPSQQTEQSAARPVADHARAGGHLAAVRMGWEAS
jgi:hypothetical protein